MDESIAGRNASFAHRAGDLMERFGQARPKYSSYYRHCTDWYAVRVLRFGSDREISADRG